MPYRNGVILYDPVMDLRKELDSMLAVEGITTKEKGVYLH